MESPVVETLRCQICTDMDETRVGSMEECNHGITEFDSDMLKTIWGSAGQSTMPRSPSQLSSASFSSISSLCYSVLVYGCYGSIRKS